MKKNLQLPAYAVSLLGAGLSVYLTTGRCLFGSECLRGEILGTPVPVYGLIYYLAVAVGLTLGVYSSLRLIAAIGFLVHASLLIRTLGQYTCLTCLIMFTITAAVTALAFAAEPRQRHLVFLTPVAALIAAYCLVIYPPAATGTPANVPALQSLSPTDTRVTSVPEQAPKDTQNETTQNTARATSTGPDKDRANKQDRADITDTESSGAKPSQPAQTRPVAPGETTLTVWTAEGVTQELDLEKKPALLFSWWCFHCDEALSLVASLPETERPYLVAVYNDGDYLRETGTKLSPYGLTTVYYSEYEPGLVPCLLTAQAGKLSVNNDYANLIKQGGTLW